MSDLIEVAFLSYFFPPIGGGGTPRTVKFVKYLHLYGYRPTVVTVAPKDVSYSREFQVDHDQILELSEALYEVNRVPNPGRNGIQSAIWKSRWFPWIWAAAYPWYYEDVRPWAVAASKQLLRQAKTRPYSLIYATAGPNSTLVAAANAARRLRIPWLADLRDLWTVDSLKTFPSRFHYRWLSRLERRILRSAGAVIANTPIAGQRMQQWLGADRADRVHVIQNGFDPDEFHATAQLSRRPPDGTITIVHAGTLYDPAMATSRLGRYRPYDLDNAARSVKPIVDGLAALQRQHPETATRFRVRLLGHTPEKSLAYIAQSGLSKQIACEGVRPRAEAMDAIREADGLLVVQVAFADADKPVPYVPGKVYDYLATGSPIIAPVPPGDLRNFLFETPQAYVCDYRDAAGTASCLERLASDLDNRRTRTGPVEWLNRFSHVELTARLAKVFDDVACETLRKKATR